MSLNLAKMLGTVEVLELGGIIKPCTASSAAGHCLTAPEAQ